MTDQQFNQLMREYTLETNEAKAQALLEQLNAELARRNQLVN